MWPDRDRYPVDFSCAVVSGIGCLMGNQCVIWLVKMAENREKTNVSR